MDSTISKEDRERIDQGIRNKYKDFLAILEQAGFQDAELVAETGFNSSPKTKGVLFRALKP